MLAAVPRHAKIVALFYNAAYKYWQCKLETSTVIVKSAFAHNCFTNILLIWTVYRPSALGSRQTPAVGKYTVHLRYNHSFFVLVMYLHVTQLGVSRSKEIQLEICRSLHINNRICFELSTFFWTARGCADGVSFHGLLRSETEFRYHLPIVLRIHTP